MGKHKHSKAMSFLHLPQEAEIHTIPKRSEKWIAMTRKKMEKTEAFQNYGFLKSCLNVSRERETHTIPKTLEKWIAILWGKYRKTQIFQSYRFLANFAWSKKPYNSQDMRKIHSHSKGKTWKNTNIPKLKVSYIFCMKQKSMQFPKHGMN